MRSDPLRPLVRLLTAGVVGCPVLRRDGAARHDAPWITALAWVTLRERTSRAGFATLALASVTIVPLERPTRNEGALAGLAASGTSAVAMVLLRRLSGETPEAVVARFSVVASVVLTAATALRRARCGPLDGAGGGVGDRATVVWGRAAGAGRAV
jgi:hypothetical protein